MTPYLVFLIFFILGLIIFFNGLSNLDLHLNVFQVIGIAIVSGLVAGLIAAFLVKRIKDPRTPLRQHNFQVEFSLKKAQKHLERVEAASFGEVQDKIHNLFRRG